MKSFNSVHQQSMLSLIVLALLLFNAYVVTAVSTSEKTALVNFYYALSGPQWTTQWNLTNDPCTWYTLKLSQDRR